MRQVWEKAILCVIENMYVMQVYSRLHDFIFIGIYVLKSLWGTSWRQQFQVLSEMYIACVDSVFWRCIKLLLLMLKHIKCAKYGFQWICHLSACFNYYHLRKKYDTASWYHHLSCSSVLVLRRSLHTKMHAPVIF